MKTREAWRAMRLQSEECTLPRTFAKISSHNTTNEAHARFVPKLFYFYFLFLFFRIFCVHLICKPKTKKPSRIADDAMRLKGNFGQERQRV